MAHNFSTCDLILLGKCTIQDDQLNVSEQFTTSFFKAVERDQNSSAFHASFQKCRTNLERILFLRRYFTWIEVTGKEMQESRKNGSMSTLLRERGNKSFKEKSWARAIRAYNLAICFGPVPSTELGTAYANRAAALLEQGYGEQCLQDIELALQYGYPESLYPKLKERRLNAKAQAQATCKTESGFGVPGKYSDYCAQVLFKIPSLSASDVADAAVAGAGADERVEIRKNEEWGRHLVVNAGVPASTVLIVEDPYVKILKDELTWEVDHCHHCLAKLRFGHGFPCLRCVFAIYCSDTCRDAAFREYHNFECPCLSFLYVKKTPRHVLMSFRIICKAGPGELYRLFKKSTEGQGQSQDQDQLGPADPAYTAISGLISHSDSDTISTFSNTLQAIILGQCLRTYSNFFTCITDDSQEFHNFVTGSILSHLRTVPYNSISLDELKGLRNLSPDDPKLKDTVRNLKSHQVAVAIYSLISLINHSCHPNVTRINDTVNGTVSIVSLQALRPGDQLFTSYTQHFLSSGLDERQAYLAATYQFRCACRACMNDWPGLDGLQARDERGLVFTCSSDSAVLQADKDKYVCSKCGTVVEADKIRSKFHTNVDSFFSCYESLLRNQPLEILDKLCTCLEYCQANIQGPFGRFFMAQDLLKRSLDMIVANKSM